MKIKKERLHAAIEESAKHLFEESGDIKKEKLYLTRRQYELDLEGWKKLLRQRGLPDDAVEIIPEIFSPN